MHIDQLQEEPLRWPDGKTPHSRRYGDRYYDSTDGLAEARYVFLRGNDLPARFQPGFRIAELGFGTGLNLFAAMQCWKLNGIAGRLRYTGFEAYPLPASEMRRAAAQFPELRHIAEAVIERWDPGMTGFRLAGIEFTLIIGDARDTVPQWIGEADAWFLDGFAPRCNPELWEPDLLRAVASKTAEGGSFATYTAAGQIRRSLADAGFNVRRQAGFGDKRHMSCGRKGVSR
ncbi:MAG: tRNA (5-methylaminomethyl-2-thiouridine)(34)-methyltransferase MnmD [Rhodobacteraceae bacterium]|nr:tRNA (5-methylaminomethyl-2-thiouridine)(34)-methyltransferase MnmD [Paracoccaceae bacterium]